MNFRHAAALALVGWYLVIPHTMPDSGAPDLSRPMWQWNALGPVASKDDCEAKRTSAIRKADSPPERAEFKKHLPEIKAQLHKQWPNQKMPSDDYYENQYWEDAKRVLALGVCVTGDDPRLKPK
jgi:hypothetical protein